MYACALTTALALGAAETASATTVAYSGDLSTLIVTGGDNAAHEIAFRGVGGNDEILDPVGFTTYPGDCSVLSLTPTPTWISCPGRVGLQVDLGAGNDSINFLGNSGAQFSCFNTYTLNLGDGANSLSLSTQCPADPPSTATVTSLAGADVLTGGSQTVINFSSGGGDDSVYGGSGNDVIHGGDGFDRVFGYAGNDQVFGDEGADHPNGGLGNDLVDGGGGDDALEYSTSAVGSHDTGAGADNYVGGAGTDTLWLDNHPGGVTITMDGVANDGTAGETDNVNLDVEASVGTLGNDVFTGSAAPDNFSGYGGNDEIHGGGGNDDLYGGDEDDKLYGDAGNDKLQGAVDADTVDGGAGADQLYGDVAGCSVFCTADPDVLLARDGEKDTVDCGGGADSATVDFGDVVAFCAVVDRSADPSAQTSPPPDPTFGLRTFGTPRVSKGLRMGTTCSVACSYSATLRLSAKLAKRFGLGRRAVTIGRVRGTLTAAGDSRRRLVLTDRARRKLRSASSVRTTLRVGITHSGGTVTRLAKGVVLRH